MTPKEKDTLEKEKLQIRGYLQALREENEQGEKKLASIVTLITSLRKNYLATKITLDVFEEKLTK